VVLWHGMGDDCCNPESMGRIQVLLQDSLPGVFVHSVQVGDNRDEDHESGFFGQVSDQVDLVCEQLAGIPELADGFNAIGFSQGGLFLRAYVQRCNRPAVKQLITFGSPHGGVTDIPNCMGPRDFRCNLMRSLIRYGVYSAYVQHRVVQAQYYKDPRNIEGYLAKNIFLPDLNNEGANKNQTYAENLAQLDRFVMVRFAEDRMVKPAETAWFWTVDEEGALVPLEKQELYQDDWLGLQKLGGRLEFLVSPGQHVSCFFFTNKEKRTVTHQGGMSFIDANKRSVSPRYNSTLPQRGSEPKRTNGLPTSINVIFFVLDAFLCMNDVLGTKKNSSISGPFHFQNSAFSIYTALSRLFSCLLYSLYPL
ncbi:Alpha/Beta hydrolase protein, partial [Syncephalastrum racemosum]